MKAATRPWRNATTRSPTRHRPMPLTHPAHLATVATLFGLAPPPVPTCRVLEVGCSDGANLLPMAASLPDAQLRRLRPVRACHRLARSRRGAELGLRQRHASCSRTWRASGTLGTFDYIIAHGVYSWVPARARSAARLRLARDSRPSGVMFVSYNRLPGCHMRAAAWDVLHYHVDGIADPRDRLDAGARTLAALLAEPGAVQTEADGALRDGIPRARDADRQRALPRRPRRIPNDPVYFHAVRRRISPATADIRSPRRSSR